MPSVPTQLVAGPADDTFPHEQSLCAVLCRRTLPSLILLLTSQFASRCRYTTPRGSTLNVWCFESVNTFCCLTRKALSPSGKKARRNRDNRKIHTVHSTTVTTPPFEVFSCLEAPLQPLKWETPRKETRPERQEKNANSCLVRERDTLAASSGAFCVNFLDDSTDATRFRLIVFEFYYSNNSIPIWKPMLLLLINVPDVEILLGVPATY